MGGVFSLLKPEKIGFWHSLVLRDIWGCCVCWVTEGYIFWYILIIFFFLITKIKTITESWEECTSESVNLWGVEKCSEKSTFVRTFKHACILPKHYFFFSFFLFFRNQLRINLLEYNLIATKNLREVQRINNRTWALNATLTATIQIHPMVHQLLQEANAWSRFWEKPEKSSHRARTFSKTN